MDSQHTINEVITENTNLFEQFDLTIYLGPESITWISASSSAGAIHGIPRYGAKFPALDNLLDMTYDFTDDIRFAQSRSNSVISPILGELVFGDPTVLQLFQVTRGIAAARRRQVLFRILAAPHLATLPWELLPDPGIHVTGSSYLALAPDILLARQARGRTYPMKSTLVEAPLNLLLVLSSPIPENDSEDGLSFDIFEVKRNLLSELNPLVRAGLLRIDVEDCPTVENLRRRIGAQRRGYHLFHYIGHAIPEGLILEDRAGRREDLPATKLVDLLRLCRDLRLAVFAGCETARPATDPASVNVATSTGWRDLLSLSDYCVQEACPAVIGMQAVLPFSIERIFTRFFYQALVNGYSIAESLRLSRGAIQSNMSVGGNLLNWSVPTLFVGSDEPGAIVPRTSNVTKVEPNRRAELNLGLRQRNMRFFGRDLPLRQTVEMINGRMSERVLVITGGAGVGKTSLVDRALEEAGETISHVLFISVNYLAPDDDRGWEMFADNDFSADMLKQHKFDDVIKKLCIWSNELLRTTGIGIRDWEEGWDPIDWWQRIVEVLIPRQFVVVIDDIGEIDKLQRRLLEKLLGRVISAYLKDNPLEGEKSLQQEFTNSSDEIAISPEETIIPSLSALFEKIKLPTDMVPEIEKLTVRLVPDYKRFIEQQIFAETREQSSLLGGTLPKGPEINDLYAILIHLEKTRQCLGTALIRLAERRSLTRIIVTAEAPLKDFFNLNDEFIFQMRLAPLTWAETWRWIRRNLPGLIVYEDELAQFWQRFGEQIELWEELELQVLKKHNQTINLRAIADNIRPPRISRPTTRSLGPTTSRGSRPLRIAVAGPFLSGKMEVAAGLTQLAIDHGIGSRVILDTEGQQASLATLIDEPSPFEGENDPSENDIYNWLDSVLVHHPDIILLDFSLSDRQTRLQATSDKLREKIQKFRHSILFIASDGHKSNFSRRFIAFPSSYPEVLSIGPLDDEGRLRPYAAWHQSLLKPNLFMPDNLRTPQLISLLNSKKSREYGTLGSSFASINALATIVLVWFMFPGMSPEEVRQLLIEASVKIPGRKGARGLTMEVAIDVARRRLVRETLSESPASMQTLSAITGFERDILLSILETMIKDGHIERRLAGRLPQFQLV